MRGHQEKTPHHFPSMLFACAFTPDGRHLATADKVGHIVVWEAATGKQAATLEAPVMYTWDPVQRRHSIGGIRALAFSPDGRLLAAGGIGKIGNIDHLEGKARVEVFDWARGQRTHEFPGDKFNGLVESLRFHPEGAWLLAGGGANDGFLMFFDLGAKKALRQEKVSMHVHDLVLGDGAATLYAAGHGKIAVFEMKG
jgi:WD40 repeat protein